MLPSIAQTSLTVNESACRSQQASCPLPLPNMWTISGAYQVDKGPETQSNLIDAAAWDQDYAALLEHGRFGKTLQRSDDFTSEWRLCGSCLPRPRYEYLRELYGFILGECRIHSQCRLRKCYLRRVDQILTRKADFSSSLSTALMRVSNGRVLTVPMLVETPPWFRPTKMARSHRCRTGFM